EQADQEAAVVKEVEHGRRVVVELEVHRLRPAALHLDGGGVRVALAAHAADDPLREEHPDLLVVIDLRVTLDLGERRRPRGLVARRVEVEPVPPAELAVAVRAEVRPRTGDREVDVEDDRAQHGSTIGARSAAWARAGAEPGPGRSRGEKSGCPDLKW